MPKRKKKTRTNAEIMQDVTAKMIERIREGGLLPWQSAISVRYDDANRPRNPWSGHESTRISYSMGNALYLQLMGMLAGYSDPRWAGYGHIKDNGGQVRKGEKSFQVVQARPVFERDESGQPATREDGSKVVKFYKLSTLNVFNVEQADWSDGSLPALERDTVTVDRNGEIEATRKAYCSKARVGYMEKDFGPGESACYMPNAHGEREDRGRVVMPRPEAVTGYGNWVLTLGHELIHSTGHDDLLNRSLKGYQANAKSYSKEELVAELGGAIMASHFGVSVDYDNSAAYLEGWLSKFEGSPDLLHHALRDADKAIRMILDHEGLS